MSSQPPPPPPNHQPGVCRALHPYVLVLLVVSIFGFVGFDPCLGRWVGRCVWSVCFVLGDICTCVYLLGCWRPGIVMVFAPPTVRSWEQVAVAKSFSRHLNFNELTFITLLDLSIRSSNHVSVDECPALCNEGTTLWSNGLSSSRRV